MYPCYEMLALVHKGLEAQSVPGDAKGVPMWIGADWSYREHPQLPPFGFVSPDHASAVMWSGDEAFRVTVEPIKGELTMPTAVAAYPMLQIEYSREEIPVETMTPRRVPDEGWRFVDGAGHGHFWQGLGELPTLEWVVTGTHWIGVGPDAEEVDEGEHRCRICAEVIKPGMRVSYGPTHVPGPVMFAVTIEGERFNLTEEMYRRALECWATIVREIAR